MLAFLVSRAAQAFLTLLLLTGLIFGLSRVLGNPLDVLLPIDAPDETRERLTIELGLDRPLPEQYFVYLGDLAQGQLGQSIRTGEPVGRLIIGRLQPSLQLGAVALAFTIAAAIPLGTLAAVRRGTAWDGAARLVALIGMSAPNFWVGIVLIRLVSVNLGWLPASGTGSLAHFILPAFTLSLFVLSGMVRLVRTSMLEVLDSEFVLFARCMGLSERRVIFKHALRNALVPVLGFGGVYFSIMITMAVVVEVVFAWPGLGRLAFNAILLRDFPVMQGVILSIGVTVVVLNMLVDILYAVVDPRIRYGRA